MDCLRAVGVQYLFPLFYFTWGIVEECFYINIIIYLFFHCIFISHLTILSVWCFSNDRPNLVSQKDNNYAKGVGRPLTITSLDETGASTNLQSSPTNLNAAQEDDKTMLTGRSSSQVSQPSGDLLTQRSQESISSQSHVSTIQQELSAEDG